MALIKKKGASGAASNYITRTRAIRKLQLSLADFRRLCILKGIYPRQPSSRKKAAGASGNTAQTFYYSKDIQFLLHEPLVQKLRDRKAFMKKLSRAIGKHEESLVRKLEENEPVLSLNHLVKERYPSFVDAVRDLDDCLCHVFMFASLPTTGQVVKKRLDDSQRLAAEFQNYVIASHALRKVFLSIKGIYYQAEIKGQPVTWLVPYMFSQDIPADVDFRVMLTFLEFYQTMLGFVNFKLYHDQHLFYPPQLNAKLDEHGAGMIASYIVQPAADGSGDVAASDSVGVDATGKLTRKEKQTLKKQAMHRLQTLEATLKKLSAAPQPEDLDSNDNEDASAEQTAEESSAAVDVFPGQDGGNVTATPEQSHAKRVQTLFAGKRIFLSREVPRYSLEFVILACGGTVAWPETSGPGSPFDEASAEITHHVVDRPVESLSLHGGRAYIQPQWVYDCVNAGALLDPAAYGPGCTLPPHLSPFVSAPALSEEMVKELDMEEQEEKEKNDETAADAKQESVDVLDRVKAAPTAETLHELELEAEVAGVAYDKVAAATAKTPAANVSKKAAAQKKEAAAKKEEQERVQMAKMLMSNKKRKLLERIESSKGHKAEAAKNLERRRRAIAAKK